MADVWTALADPKRRRVMEILQSRECSVNDLVAELRLPQPMVSKHLRHLREAGLVRMHKNAQQRIYAIEPASLAELDEWLAPYRHLWNDRLDALGAHLKRKEPRKK